MINSFLKEYFEEITSLSYDPGFVAIHILLFLALWKLMEVSWKTATLLQNCLEFVLSTRTAKSVLSKVFGVVTE